MKEAAHGTLTETKATAEAQVKACAEETKRELTAAVARTADDVAKEKAREGRLKWTSLCAAICAIVLVFVGWAGYRKGDAAGHDRGLVNGYQIAKDEKAAVSWTNTAEGQLASALAQAGDLRQLAECTGVGWRYKDGFCYPMTDRGAACHPWRVPARPRVKR